MRTIYYQPEPKTDEITITVNPLLDISDEETDLDNPVSVDVLELYTATSSDKTSKRFSPKSEKRNKLFEGNKEKSNIELIQLLQKEEPATLFLAAKKAVERWRSSTKRNNPS